MFDAHVGTVVLILVGVVTFLYRFGPLVIRLTQRMNSDIDFIPFKPETSPPPPDIAAFFEKNRHVLTSLAFSDLGAFVLPNAVANVTSVAQLYVHQDNRDGAMIAAIFATADQQQVAAEVHYLEFTSRFQSGVPRVINTSNTDEIGAFVPLPQELTFRFPHVEDASYLYRLHKSLVQRHADGRSKVLRVLDEYHGDVATYVRDVVFAESYRDQETAGYLWYDEASACWRPTIRGAYLTTWTVLWPARQLLRRHVRRKAHRIEQELNRSGTR